MNLKESRNKGMDQHLYPENIFKVKNMFSGVDGHFIQQIFLNSKINGSSDLECDIKKKTFQLCLTMDETIYVELM